MVSYVERILSALDVERVVELPVSDDPEDGSGGGGGAIAIYVLLYLLSMDYCT